MGIVRRQMEGKQGLPEVVAVDDGGIQAAACQRHERANRSSLGLSRQNNDAEDNTRDEEGNFFENETRWAFNADAAQRIPVEEQENERQRDQRLLREQAAHEPHP